MPGHIKLGKSGEPDPDPAPYLIISMDMKRADMLKPYDAKKSYWGPDGQGGFREGLLQEDDGTKATMMMGHEVISRSSLSFSMVEIGAQLLYFLNFRKKSSSQLRLVR